MENTSNSEKSPPENTQLSSSSQRTSRETGSQTVSKHSQAEEDSKVIKNEFKKVGHLDITVLCSVCQQSVNIKQLFHHKKAHQAQARLNYQEPWAETIDVKQITVRQQQLVSDMRKTSMYTEREREKICCSFEFLKESLKVAPYFCINSVVQSSVQVKEVNSPLIKAIAICQDKNTLWRAELEDIVVVLDNYGNKLGTCFLGLFDGNNGVSAAETTSVEFPILFLEQLSSGDSSYRVSEAERQVLDSFRTVFRADYKMRERVFTVRNTALKDKRKASPPSKYEWIHRAYAKSFWRMDRLLRLGRNEVSRVCWSSCTAATCLVETLSNIKQQQQDQEEEEQLGKEGSEGEQIITQDEKEQPERIMVRSCKEQSNIEEQGLAQHLSYPKTEEELKRKNEDDTDVSEQEDKVLPPSDTDSTRKMDLLEDKHSTAQPEESSFGETHISNSTEQEVARLSSDQKTESIRTDYDEEELEGIKEDTSFSEQEDIELPPNNIDNTRKKDLLEDNYSTAQPEESSFGGMHIADNIEEQRMAQLSSNLKTESVRTDDEEDELTKLIEEDTSVSEQEDLPPSNKDSTRKKDVLENNDTTSQSDESSFGGMHIVNNIEEEGVVPLLSSQKIDSVKLEEEEEELKRLGEEDTIISEQEDTELPPSDTDSTRKMDLLEDNHSTAQPEESSSGVVHIADNAEEQGVAPLLSNQKTEGIETQEEDEVLERINEADTGVSEQENKELPPSDKDNARKKDGLEKNRITIQPDENSFGVMHISNMGNVHAIVCKNGKSYWLTTEHTTSSNEERIRVLEKGGYISSNEPKGLIEGLVRTTRALGHHGNPTLKKTVIPVPHTMSVSIDSSCQFLILASNGLWEVLDKSEVVTLTFIMFSAYLKKYQQVQQEKERRISKVSKLTVDDVEEDIISLYFDPEIFSADTENNQNQNNANLEPPANSTEEADRERTGSTSESSKVEQLEGTVDEAKESNEDLPTLSTTEESTEESTESGSPEESKEKSKSIEEEPELSSDSFSEISEDEANPRTFYNHAAKYISKHLVNAALKAGSRDNITVLVVLLNGCDKIPTYI
ncbi:hypothetical protein lerEdw1_020246 [Lerista edwardsae]|nr:hypothetical protein lerEdw1_020246 [Lerista edwardsae]